MRLGHLSGERAAHGDPVQELDALRPGLFDGR
jgi:hypothetical protein